MKKKLSLFRFLLKLKLRMKLTILILCLCILQVSASTTNGQNFDLQVKNQSLKEVLKVIENKTTYRFFYNDVVMDLNMAVTLNLSDKNIQQVMNELLNNSEVSYKILNNNLIVIAPALELQQTTVKGTITDAGTGEKLPGVNVIIEGTTTGVITDVNGQFSIEVSKPDVNLIFSYVGYMTETVHFAGQKTIDVKLSPDIKKLDEIVVVGYGTAKKSDISGSVASVSNEEMMKKNPTNILQGLQGQAAGVLVTTQDGSPESNAAIRIRGVATINGTAKPLYVVDGVQVGDNANFLAPSDVESIEVLKDASATAIYGSAGANGVIMITTKHGSVGSTHITFSADYGVQTIASTLKTGNADQFAACVRTARANDGANIQNQVFSEQYDGQRKTIDWQKELTHTSLKQQYNLSASGGTEKTQSNFSVSYLNNDGVIVNTNYNRLTGRGNVVTKVANFLEIGGDINFVHSEWHGSNAAIGNNGNISSLRDMAFYCPTMDYVENLGTKANPVWRYVSPNVKNSNGTYGVGYQPNQGYDGGGPQNLYAEQMESNGLTKRNQLIVNANASIKLFKGLIFKTIGSYNFAAENYNRFWGNKKRYETDGITQIALNGYDTRTQLDINSNQDNTLAIESYLTYNWKNDVHNLTLMAGNSVSKYFGMENAAHGIGFPGENIRDITLTNEATDRTATGKYRQPVNKISYFGRAVYSFKDRYIFTGTIRRDGSSNFGISNVWGTFPSAAVAWRISEEDFLKSSQTINNLKLRLGWGRTGNAGTIGDKAVTALTSKSIGYYYYGQNGVAGLGSTAITGNGLVATLVDTKLKWETNEQSNIGIDLGLLKNNLTITADYFVRNSKDLLLNMSIRPSAGYNSVYTNYGEVSNKGVELSINYKKQINQDWSIGAILTGSSLKNKVKKMGADLFSVSTNNTNDGSNVGAVGSSSGVHWDGHSICREGYAVGSFYGYKVEGIFQSDDEVITANADARAKGHAQYQMAETTKGDYKYKDINDDGFIDSKDMTILGNGFPKVNYGLTLTTSYKNWDLSIYSYGVLGQKLYSYSAMRLSNMYGTDDGTIPNLLTSASNDAWTEANHSNSTTKLSILDLNQNMRGSDAWIKNGDFLKISNIQIGYNFNKNLLKSLHIEGLRLNVSVQNVVCISSYNKYGDPEAGQGNVLFTGLETGHYPNPRIYTVGLNLQF
jgi:TonB-dependent starch-binding outer membrane protein SusC